MSEPPRLQEADTYEHAIGRRETSEFHDNTICIDSRKFEHKNATSRRNGPSRWGATRNHSNDLAVSGEKDAGFADSTHRSSQQNEFNGGQSVCWPFNIGILAKYQIRPNWKRNTGKRLRILHIFNFYLFFFLNF